MRFRVATSTIKGCHFVQKSARRAERAREAGLKSAAGRQVRYPAIQGSQNFPRASPGSLLVLNIKINVCVSVCLSVCVYTIQIHMRAPISTKLGTVKFWDQGQVFNASSTLSWPPPRTWSTGPSWPRSGPYVENTFFYKIRMIQDQI